MTRLIMLLAALAALPAQAATCSKIDYAEARDWPVERLELTYCADLKSAEARRQHLREAGTLLTASERAAILADVGACYDQASLIGRVLQDRHGRPRPSC